MSAVDLIQPGAFEAAFFDPTSTEMRANPWPYFRRLRDETPVYETVFGSVIVTGYEESVLALRDPRFSVDPRNAALLSSALDNQLGPAQRGFDDMMLFVDPPRHTRLRALVNKAFAPRVVEGLRPRVQQIVDDLIDVALDEGLSELMSQLSFPLPVTVICEMLGIPASDRDDFRRWTADITPVLDPFVPPEKFQRVAQAGFALLSYFEQLIEDRRAHPRSDLLTELIRAEEEGQRLSAEELRATCVLLLIAGHETTMNVIGNGSLALLSNRDQWERLQRHPDLVRTAVEELVRYAGPGALTARIALEDVELGGKVVPKGQFALVMIGAANRDPRVFPHPETFDVGRNPNRHLGFGAGPHFCIGATLARAEIQIALSTMARRVPSLHLTGEPEWREMVTFRGLKKLPVGVNRS